MADGADAVRGVIARFPDAVAGSGEFRDQHWVEVRLDRWVEVASWLRDDPVNAYDLFLDVSAVHRPGDVQPFELVYHLYSLSRNDRLRVKVRVAETENPPTVSHLWKAANWNERETYDMFGIRFDGHPDLRRILMPDDYTDFPLRKEFPLYRG